MLSAMVVRQATRDDELQHRWIGFHRLKQGPHPTLLAKKVFAEWIGGDQAFHRLGNLRQSIKTSNRSLFNLPETDAMRDGRNSPPL